MINLLPPEEKRQLAASRTNSLLLRYSVLMLIIVGLLIVEVIGMNFVVDAGTAQNQAVIQENEQKTASYSATKQEAKEFTSNLATAKYILSKQIPYNMLIFTISNKLPAGTVLDTLSIDPATFGTPTTLSIRATSYDKAIAVKTALQEAVVNEKIPLFSSVSFLSIVNNEEQGGGYAFQATYSVTYSKAALSL